MNIINKKYTIIDKIGSGTFGTIFKGQNIRTRELVAIKIESIKSETMLLKNESKIYQYLKDTYGIPCVKWFGKDNDNYYMVINLLGESLQTFKDKSGELPIILILQIGIKMLNLVKTIHQKGLVHRDIKPDNFLFGVNDTSKDIFIIDFGFCKSFLDGDTHIEMNKTNSIIGSQTYVSINGHEFQELGRRDDLESLGYVFLYLYFGKLDWQYVTGKFEYKNNLIRNMKENIINNTNIPEVFINYIKYVRTLSFEEEPDYIFLIENFKREIEIS